MKVAFFLLPLCLSVSLVSANASTSVNCGTVHENEFSKSSESHVYAINMAPGDTFGVRVNPVGEYLATNLHIKEPVGNLIESKGAPPPGNVSLKTKPLSGRGEYQVIVMNYYRAQGTRAQGARGGLYTIAFTCTLRNGEVISP